MEQPRGLRESFAKVLEDPSRDVFRDALREHTGEMSNLDFKEHWPSDEKLARHVLALGNSGGGCLVVGVAERSDKSLEPVGLSEFKDKVDITKKITPLVPEALLRNVRIDDFAYDATEYEALKGKKFQLVSVLPDPEHLPFVAVKANADARLGAVYVRRGTESVEASHDELQRIINERIATGHSTAVEMKLEDHLDQLIVLEGRIPRKITVQKPGTFDWAHTSAIIAAALASVESKPNPDFPSEDAQAFIRRMFEAKKLRIARELDVPSSHK